MYCTTHNVKVPFCMPQFSSSKIINHRFYVDNYKGELGIVYDMIICSDLMVQLGLTGDFKRQFLQWDCATLHMKEPSSFLGKYNLTKRKMRELVIHTEEPDSTQEATEKWLKSSTVPMQRQTLSR